MWLKFSLAATICLRQQDMHEAFTFKAEHVAQSDNQYQIKEIFISSHSVNINSS